MLSEKICLFTGMKIIFTYIFHTLKNGHFTKTFQHNRFFTFSRRFYPKRLTIQAIHFFNQYVCRKRSRRERGTGLGKVREPALELRKPVAQFLFVNNKLAIDLNLLYFKIK